jgi:hypothetical protein
VTCLPSLIVGLSSCSDSSLRAKQSRPSLIVKSLANLFAVSSTDMCFFESALNAAKRLTIAEWEFRAASP